MKAQPIQASRALVVLITQRTYAHLVPEMWEQDCHRVAFTLPESGAVYALTKRKLRAV